MDTSKFRDINRERNLHGISFPEDLLKKVASLPTKPGVYLHKNEKGDIIYIGKAKNLRNRVRSYFQHGKPVDAKTKALIAKIADTDTIVVDSEAEALILEDTLIKKHKPRYNIMLRDDKTYPYIRITNEAYPRIFPTRTIIRDGSKYIGPITEVTRLHQLMKVIKSILPLRSCNYNLNKETVEQKKYKLCLDYQIKKCDGPCEGLISQEDYLSRVNKAIQIINGKSLKLEKDLRAEMELLASEMRFEEAALLRNKINILKDYLSRQTIITNDEIDRDIFGIAHEDDLVCTIIFKVRDGKLIGKRHFIIKNTSGKSDASLLQSTMEQWFMENEFVPDEIFLPVEPEDTVFILDWLKKIRGKSLKIIVPKIGDKKSLVNMAVANAGYMLKEHLITLLKREQSIPRMVLSLQRDLNLASPPRRIECFDNSHIQGSELVSSMVCFVDGKPKKSDYRKYKIKTVDKNDDFAAMRETVKRRYSRVLNENLEMPDLIIVDGGKGQLSSAFSVLKELNLEKKVNIIGLAKRLEEVFLPDQSEAINLPKTSSSLRLIQQLRDEAHRFAITFHRQLREKRTLQSEITKIKGIGEKTANKLLITFGSVEGIKNANEEELIKIAGNKTAKSIRNYFSESKSDTKTDINS